MLRFSNIDERAKVVEVGRPIKSCFANLSRFATHQNGVQKAGHLTTMLEVVKLKINHTIV